MGTPKWSWQSYWITVCVVAWFVMPLAVAAITTPDLPSVLLSCPAGALLKITLLGAAYGFGGMAFAVAIRYIGFSLTYAIAIGISAVVGTVVPAILNGTLVSDFQKPGGSLVLTGFIVSIVGVAVCGRAGFMKEGELGTATARTTAGPAFDMRKGLTLVILAGVLWFGQFVLYEQGHARMGNFGFISWGIHMAMLIFFSFGVGLAFKEWNACRRPTILTLLAGLATLLGAFALITCGSRLGEQATGAEGQEARPRIRIETRERAVSV